jgi:arabinan endo-1,5-alpha-L-arabinosidase
MRGDVCRDAKCKGAIALGVCILAIACNGPPDVVASSKGDFDPNNPPQALTLSGSILINDPAVIRVGQRVWLYATGPGIVVKSSVDLQSWQDEKQVFQQNPSWIADLVPNATDLWSPYVAFFGGKYHLYYAASTFGSAQSCIGHATADSIGQGSGFVDQGSVICSDVNGAVENFNAIDPSLYFDVENQPWLVFGSYDSGIKIIALNPDGGRLDTQMTALATRSSDNPAIQAPYLMKRGDYYYLFVSFDRCCNGVNSDHNIRVGRATNLLGPYVDRDGNSMIADTAQPGGGTLVLAGDNRWKGPGSNVIFTDAAKRYNVFHAYDANANGQATLRIAELAFDNEGWPVSGGP